MPTTTKQDRDFADELSSIMSAAMSEALRNSSYDWVLDWVAKNFEPSDVFSDKDLSAWAEANGYTRA